MISLIRGQADRQTAGKSIQKQFNDNFYGGENLNLFEKADAPAGNATCLPTNFV